MVQYDVTTPQAYLEVLEDDWRKEKLLRLREMIQTAAPEATEGLAYKMLSYGMGEEQFMALNAQKHYVSVYVGDIEKVPDSQTLLQGFNLGKGCVRVRKTQKLDESGIEQFIQNAVAMWRDGQDINC
ncbi:iron chaperone [Fundicoccus sp. Sow4_D5]|uniref:iron chaperone n=1 Tax=Fundicoccus sp. Sow4_D5 TaxID=3438782 RepID=UPI003F93D136